MKQTPLQFLLVALLLSISFQEARSQEAAKPDKYLLELQAEMQVKWPKNRAINLVFHGHSVPAGYWHNSEVHTLDSYPHIVLENVKAAYPHAVINMIVTAIGGENSMQGVERMKDEVLVHRPDVLFIDYALNDMWHPTEKVAPAWKSMIEQALAVGVKVILVTPSPDQREAITENENRLALHAEQIRKLAAEYGIGLADPFEVFQLIAKTKLGIKPFMSHVNHPNRAGHEIMAAQILPWLVSPEE